MHERTKSNSGSKSAYMTLLMSTAKWHEACDPSHPDAVVRTFEDDSKTLHTKHELVWDDVVGHITSISNDDSGDFGDKLRVRMRGLDGNSFVLTIPYSRFGEDFLKRIPNANPSLLVRLYPWRMTPKDSPNDIMGISISQPPLSNPFEEDFKKWEKLPIYYYIKHGNGDIEYRDGYPPMPPKGISKDRLKLYFANVLIFLKEQLPTIDNIFQVTMPPSPSTPTDVEHDSEAHHPSLRMNIRSTEVTSRPPMEEFSDDDLPF